METIKKICKWIYHALAFIGLLWGMYALWIGDKTRVPTFIVDPAMVNVVDKDAFEGLTLFDANGKKITTDISSVRFYFFNAGDEPIKPEHVLAPLKIVSDDGRSKILDYRILKISRRETGIKLGEVDKGTAVLSNDSLLTGISNVLDLDFKILEKNDGFSGQILYAGEGGLTLNMLGTIGRSKIN
jgi:hypothetical protein